jgi:DNA-3-methyladenine glycosylase
LPAAVLIRKINLLLPEEKLLDGPGKICRYIGINKNHDKIDVTNGDFIKLYDIGYNPKVSSKPRVGIAKNTGKLWRFILA